MNERKIRLSRMQQAALEKLSKPGRYFLWGQRPQIWDASGQFCGSFHFQTAISFRWRDYAEKEPATGHYVITDAGRKAIEGRPSVLVQPFSIAHSNPTTY